MNIQELKQKLGIDTLNLNTCTTTDGQPYVDKQGGQWMRHWSNNERIEVSISKSTLAEVKTKNPSTLDIQTEKRQGPQGEYTAHRIVMYSPAEETL